MTSRACALVLVAALAPTLLALPDPAPAETPAKYGEIGPARPFGDIDTNPWFQAEYLSGNQKDDARQLWVRRLTPVQQAQMRWRCDRIMADLDRYDGNAELICISVYQVLNQQQR